MYNIIKNIVSANVSLNLKDLPDAKRASKYSFYLRRKGTNLSCWYTNNLSVCKITSVKEIPSEVSSPFTSQHVLPLGRPDFISFLFYCYWDRTFYSSIYTQGQRTTSTIDWVKSFSWNSSNERFLIRINSTRFSSNRKSTRLLRFKMFQYPAPLTTFIVDFDSVVLTVYGHQEGSAKNRNAFNSN